MTRKIAIPVTSDSLTLEQKLQTELRVCPLCRFELTSPFLQRCPRCTTEVPVTDPGCGTCIHQRSCPVAQVDSDDQAK